LGDHEAWGIIMVYGDVTKNTISAALQSCYFEYEYMNQSNLDAAIHSHHLDAGLLQ
jgi:hypothetical protein